MYLLLRAEWEAFLLGLGAWLVAAQIMMFCFGAVATAAMKITRWFTSEADDFEETTAWMVMSAALGVLFVLVAAGYAVLIVEGMMGHASEYPVAVYMWAFAAVNIPWTYIFLWARREAPSTPHFFEGASLVAACGTVLLLAAFDLLGVAASAQMLCVAAAAAGLALLAVWRFSKTK